MMNCKICLQDVLEEPNADYHDKCLKQLFGTAAIAAVIPYTRKEFMKEAPKKTQGFSISGVQVKLQGIVNKGTIDIVSHGGDYIVKPCPEEYEGFPENEHVSMLIHQLLKLKTPPLGLIPFTDGTLAYVVKRYDRKKGKKTCHQEDISSMLGLSSVNKDEKYHGASGEDVLNLIFKASKSRADQMEYMKRLLLSYLLGNGDFHLKNTSMIQITESIQGLRYQLAPVYDVLNTAIYDEDGYVMCLDFYSSPDKEAKIFSAMGNGYYGYEDFFDLAEAVGLKRKALDTFYQQLLDRRQDIESLVANSFLDDALKKKYLAVINTRYETLDRKL